MILSYNKQEYSALLYEFSWTLRALKHINKDLLSVIIFTKNATVRGFCIWKILLSVFFYKIYGLLQNHYPHALSKDIRSPEDIEDEEFCDKNRKRRIPCNVILVNTAMAWTSL